MAEDKLRDKMGAAEKNGETNDTGKSCIAYKLFEAAQRGTVCVVCGHINKGNSFICEMCSNYLFD